MLVVCNKKLIAESVATVLSANQSASKVGIVNTFKVTKSKNHENNQDLTELLIFTNVTTFFMLLQSNFTNIFINTSILYQIQCFIAHFKARKHAVLYTAPHDLPDSVGLIWSPNVTNCHMVGPVDSAGFRWSKC